MLVSKLKQNWFLIVVSLIFGTILFIKKDSLFSNDENLTLVSSDDKFEMESQAIEDTDQIEEKISFIIDIKGEVIEPGVYEVDTEARVNDAIQQAGGFTEEADQESINLAQKTQDEMIIIVPKIGDNNNVIEGINSIESDQVNINYATQEEIETLNGIGPSKALAIVQYREENGFFQSVEDLLNVTGIGEKTLENIKDNIQVR